MGSINCFEPALGGPSNTLKVSHKLISKQCLGPRISEGSDHKTKSIYRIPVYVNQTNSACSIIDRFGVYFGLFWSVTLAETDPRAAAVLVDELDAGNFKSTSDDSRVARRGLADCRFKLIQARAGR